MVSRSLVSMWVALGALAACSASPSGTTSGGSGGSGGAATGGAGGAGGAPGGAGGSGNEIIFGGSGGTGANGGVECNSGPNDDADGDGFTPAQGDCNDCDKNANPGALEVVAEPDAMGNIPPAADEDCNGMVDDVAPPCDAGLSQNSFDPLDGARAIDLCQQATASSWGVMEAAYVRSNGTTPATPTRGVGLLTAFGPGSVPQKGSKMLGMSSGFARDAGDPEACGLSSCNHAAGDLSNNANPGVAPGGAFCDQGAGCYPVDAAGCSPTLGGVNDDVGLRVKLRAPTNATGFKYKFRFFSFEFPEYVCSAFNDQYVALMTPKPMGAVNSNISFDASNNPVSVNVAFFNANPNDLIGTGFDAWDDSGATDWLQTKAPIDGGTDIELLFAIWDTGDTAWDSTVLIDRFEWIADGGSVTVITEPPPPN